MSTNVFRFTLPNGIRCIHLHTPSAVTHCALTINAGSRDELPDEHGMVHFVEHCLFKGTGRRRAHHINSRLENLGGELNAFTTKEDTTVHATTLKGDFGKAAELIADVIFESVFPEHEVEREKQVVIDEINSYRDMPQEMLFDRFEELMFAGSLGRNILGTARSVKKFNSDKLKNLTFRLYRTDQMVFASVGNLSENAFAKAAERYFGGVNTDTAASLRTSDRKQKNSEQQNGMSVPRDNEENREDISRSNEENNGSKNSAISLTNSELQLKYSRIAPSALVPFEEVVAKSGNHQAHCILGGRAYDLHDERRLPLALLVNILGGPAANSRLNTVLRERNGLSYNVEAMYQPFSDTGFAAVYFGCEKENLDRCRGLVDAELQRVMETHLTPRQLSMAKKQFLGQLVISMDAGESYMLGMAKSYLVYNEIDSLQTIAGKVEGITADQIMTVAREVFAAPSTLIYR